jgi:glycosyltransferase involved in cell wall biosynthesis
MAQFLVPILFYAPDILNGEAWEFVQREIRRDFPWLLTGHDICFSGIGQGWKGWRKRSQVASHAGFRSMYFGPFNAFLAWLTHFRDTLRLSHKGTLVVLTPTPESGLGAALAKVFVGGNRVRLIVRGQGHSASKALYVKRSKWRFKIIENIERFVVSRADLVVPMGKFTYDLAVSQGAKPETMITLPFPLRWANWTEVTDLPTSPIILFVGRLEKEKGVHVLLQAMALVRERLADAHLMVAGDGSYRPTLEQLAASLGIQDKVSFLGWLEANHLKNVYRNSWLLVVPSIWEEGLGMVLVEGALMGKPVVASDLGGIRDVVRHGENGLLVPPEDAVALAEAIVKILQDRDLARRMGLTGSRVASKYLEGREAALERVRQAIYGLLGNGAK